MTNKQLEKKLKQAFAAQTPDMLPQIMASCDDAKGKYAMKQNEQNKSRKNLLYVLPRVAAAAAMVALVLFAAMQVIPSSESGVIATVYVDVNPSLELSVNAEKRVVEVVCRNEEAVAVVGDMDLTGSDITVAMNALLGSMLQQGYLTAEANSVLISVQGSDGAAAQQLQLQLAQNAGSYFAADSFDAAVLAQTLSTESSEVSQLAARQDISAGKAQLVQQLMAHNALYSEEQLAALSVNELSLLLQGAGEVEAISVSGKTSDSAYIGSDAAVDAALQHAGFTGAEVQGIRCELDFDDGIMVYEVEFYAGGMEYDYELNARNGAIVQSQREAEYSDALQSSSDTPVSAQTQEGVVGYDRAKAAALQHAGLTESQVRDFSCELEHEWNGSAYEVEFEAGGYEYEYLISAADGSVMRHKKERD